MPTVLRDGPYRVFFYSADGGEPRHVHVARDDATAKFWLDPDAMLARNRGFSAADLRTIEGIVRQNIQTLRDAWDAYFAP